MSEMSENDKQKISIAKEAYNTAKAAGDTAGMEAAHATAEAVRSKYGYSGGGDGSQHIVTVEPANGTGTGKDENGNWVSKPGGGGGGGGSSSKVLSDLGTYQEDLNKLTKAQRQAQVDELKAAQQKALANLDAQEQTIKPYYRNARNLTSASSQQGARSFAEYLANRGLTNSGAAAQGELNRQSALMNNLGNINTAEANALRDIENQRTAINNGLVSDLANANNAITTNYYNNLLNYNEQQRQLVQALQQQALGQYAGDYQAYMNTLNPNSMEYLYAAAARGNKVANNVANATNVNNALASIQAGNINYNNAAALGWTIDQAWNYYNTLQAANKAQAEQEATQRNLENEIALQKLANATAETQYKINEPYNTTVYHVSNSKGNSNDSESQALLEKIFSKMSDDEIANLING
jgi:hypothetical protein